MIPQRKGQFLINHIRITEDYPVWNDKLTFTENMRIKSSFIESCIWNMSSEEFSRIMNRWGSQK